MAVPGAAASTAPTEGYAPLHPTPQFAAVNPDAAYRPHRRRSDECHLGPIRAARSGYYLLSAEGLLRGDTAVDDKPRAGHEGRVVRGEEHDALGDIVG
jgi:hypothetical protein